MHHLEEINSNQLDSYLYVNHTRGPISYKYSCRNELNDYKYMSYAARFFYLKGEKIVDENNHC